MAKEHKTTQQTDIQEVVKASVTIGVWAESSCDHLAATLQQLGFSVVRLPSYHIRDAILSQKIQLGLVPTLTLLREPDFFSILPEVGFSSEGFPEAEIVLKNGLEGIYHTKRVAFDPRYAQEVLLTRIVLREHYGIQAKFIPSDLLTPETMFSQGEAAVMMYQQKAHQAFSLDLGMEWLELVMYPMMWGLFATARDTLSVEQAQFLRDTLKQCDCELDTVETVGLNTLIETLFFHGTLDEMPDLMFIEMPDEQEEE